MPYDLDRFVPEILYSFPGLYFDSEQDAWVVPGYRPMTVKALRQKIQRLMYRRHSFEFPLQELDYIVQRIRSTTVKLVN